MDEQDFMEAKPVLRTIAALFLYTFSTEDTVERAYAKADEFLAQLKTDIDEAA